MIALRATYSDREGWILSTFYDLQNRHMAVFQYDHGGMEILPISVLQLAKD